jgi:hypothetical protein
MRLELKVFVPPGVIKCILTELPSMLAIVAVMASKLL